MLSGSTQLIHFLEIHGMILNMHLLSDQMLYRSTISSIQELTNRQFARVSIPSFNQKTSVVVLFSLAVK